MLSNPDRYGVGPHPLGERIELPGLPGSSYGRIYELVLPLGERIRCVAFLTRDLETACGVGTHTLSRLMARRDIPTPIYELFPTPPNHNKWLGVHGYTYPEALAIMEFLGLTTSLLNYMRGRLRYNKDREALFPEFAIARQIMLEEIRLARNEIAEVTQ